MHADANGDPRAPHDQSHHDEQHHDEQRELDAAEQLITQVEHERPGPCERYSRSPPSAAHPAAGRSAAATAGGTGRRSCSAPPNAQPIRMSRPIRGSRTCPDEEPRPSQQAIRPEPAAVRLEREIQRPRARGLQQQRPARILKKLSISSIDADR